ncbi:hypothetical protein [Archangium lansingense]|uniref:Uncharacterized protein n=1 Tax=Archangium lansingense TaxID=2995310 RepID=A0ABT4AP12_9BACT|nr:hypothetical protein [Archangium lansinium]MCY1082894.1 hypothetical protein [Archangium lansinium]
MPEPRDGSPLASTPSRAGTPASFWRDAGTAFALAFRSPLAIFIFYGLAFVSSFILMHGTELQALAYLHARKANLWRVLTAFAPTTWVTILVIVLSDWQRNRSAWPHTRKGRMTVALCVVLGLPFVLLPILAQYIVWKEEPLVRAAFSSALPAASPAKSFILNLAGVTSGALVASGILGVHIQLLERLPQLRRRAEQHEADGLDEDVRWYQQHRARLSGFLTLSGLLMGTSILSVSAIRHLLNEALSTSSLTLPTAPILGYGLYYTGLIASMYLPASKALKDAGQTIAERLVRQPLEAHVTWKQRNEEQEAAQTWLGLRGSALQDFQQALSVLTPLLASFSGLILGPTG